MNAFEPSSCAPCRTRSEALQARGLEAVDDAGDERHLGADDRQRDALALVRASTSAVEIRDGYGHVARLRLASPCRRCRARTSTSLTRGDCASFQASACSRPPLPMTKTFTASLRAIQWRKCRMPVKTIAMPCSSAARDDLFVAHRAAGLHDGEHAALGGRVDAVAKRKERVRSEHRAGHVELGLLGLQRRDARAHDAARLARADADRRAVAREHDRVRFHVLDDGPRELADRAARWPSAGAA